MDYGDGDEGEGEVREGGEGCGLGIWLLVWGVWLVRFEEGGRKGLGSGGGLTALEYGVIQTGAFRGTGSKDVLVPQVLGRNTLEPHEEDVRNDNDDVTQ